MNGTQAISSPAETGISMEEESTFRYELATVWVLLVRDLRRFFRQRSRIAGALIQPLLFWLILGSGFSGTFRMEGSEGLGYLEYFYPGILLQVVLFTSIFTTMSVIEDRNEGFLQAVLVSPSSRLALVLGKSLGGTSIALFQLVLFLLVAPWAGFPLGDISWPVLLTVLFLTGLCLTGIGFFMAWKIGTIAGYHAIMSVLLLPLWVLSGAMFPVPDDPAWLATIMRFNPMTYCVEVIRWCLYGLGALPPAGGTGIPLLTAFLLIALFAVFAQGVAWLACRKGE
ncbi:MAG: ABC transporter permease [Bdellovibrionota bacterium]